MQLVLAQPAISSQLVDNLNASIHLRALLTDLFLIDEVLKTHQRKRSSELAIYNWQLKMRAGRATLPDPAL